MTRRNEIRLHVGDIDRAPIAMVKSPYHSLFALIMDAVGTTRRGTPIRVLNAISHALGPAATRAFAAMRQGARPVLLDCAVPIPPITDVGVESQIERLYSSPDDVLLDELHAEFRDTTPSWWRAARDAPERWFAALAQGAADAWSVGARRWHDAGPLLDRETVRLGTAQVRGAGAALLNNIHPRVRYGDGTITITMAEARPDAELGDRRLVLMPMVAGPDSLLASVTLADVAFIGYPVPGVRTLARGQAARPTPRADALELVLGPQRAMALRCLDRPMTLSALAVAIGCAPSTATYHCDRLAGAGLIVKERQGQSVLISRHRRGEEMVELLSR